MRLSVGSADGVDQAVERRDADTIARHRHVGTARPAVGPRVETVHGRRVLRRVRRVVATSHDVDLTVHLDNNDVKTFK